MTVTTTLARKTFAGDDVVTSFDTTFPVINSSELSVSLLVGAVETPLTENVEYSVADLGLDDTAVITYPLAGAPLATGETLIATRNTGLLQNFFDVTRTSTFNAQQLEEAFDRAFLVLQDQQQLVQTLIDEGLDTAGITLESLGGQPLASNLTTLAALASIVNLTAMAGLNFTSGDMIYATGAGALARTNSSSWGRTFIQAADVAAGRTALEVQSAAQAAAAYAPIWTSTALIPTNTGAGAYDVAIPASIEEIVVFFDEVELSGADSLRVQLSTGASFVTTGYEAHEANLATSSVGGAFVTNAFPIRAGGSGAFTGEMRMRKKLGANKWKAEVHGYRAAGGTIVGSGLLDLAGVLDAIRVTRSGSNTFTAGNIWLEYR